MRELVWMHEGKAESEWIRTSHLLAGLYNIPVSVASMFGGRGKERKPDEFMPPEFKGKNRLQDADLPKVDISILKTVFIDRQMPNVSRIPKGHNSG